MSYSRAKGYVTKPKPGVQIDWSHPLSRGLVGYWLFNEGSGSRLHDISGNQNHGTIVGSSWHGSPRGGALKLSGLATGDYVSGPMSNKGLPFTVTAWIMPTLLSRQQGIYSHDSGGNNGYRITVDSGSNKLQLVFGAVAAYTFSGLSAFTTNQWYFISVSVSGVNGTARAYVSSISGQQTDSASVSNISGTPTQFKIGWDSAIGDDSFGGSIDTVSLYNRALSAAEVAELYKNPYGNLLTPQYRRPFVAGAVATTHGEGYQIITS